MISRRLSALILSLLAFAGCHEDPTVETVVVAAGADVLTLDASGGSAVLSGLASGLGGKGGDLQAFALGSINLGFAGSAPPAPALPIAPATGTELTNGMVIAGVPISGNILVSTTLQVIDTATFPTIHSITTNNGDIVISGALIAERSGGAGTNSLILNAPAGTVYVFGTIQASGTPAPGGIGSDNPNAGSVTINASRIIVTGRIDTRGETESASTGGNGGAITLDTTAVGGGHLYATSGSIMASGGAGTSNGGDGGAVTLKAGNQLAVFAPVSTDGGAANDGASVATGGNGGTIVLTGVGGGDIQASVSTTGGSGTGQANGAKGGNGGSVTLSTAAAYRVYGSISTRGGAISATGGGTLTAGDGGAINLGLSGTHLASLEIGRGTYSTRGGSAGGTPGDAGLMDFECDDGFLAGSSSFDARGGDGISPTNTSGGKGGDISFGTDGSATSILSNHSLTLPTLASLVDARGGAACGTGTGGLGGNIGLKAGGDLTSGARLDTSGGESPGGLGGAAGTIKLEINAFTLVPTGDLLVAGELRAMGGLTGSGSGAPGNTVTLLINNAAAPGEIVYTGSIDTRGANAPLVGTGGPSGAVTISAVAGNITLGGSIVTSGGSGIAGGSPGSDVTVTCGALGGGVSSSASVTVSGGSSQAASNIDVAGSNSGNFFISVLSTIGSISILPGSILTADGGGATGPTAGGGIGGILRFRTQDQAVSISGSLLARGGTATGGGPGGMGGQVAVDSDNNADGIGGNITLNVSSQVVVSGGGGTGGGNARNGGGVPPSDSSGPNIAVIFDAAGGFVASPDGTTVGIVQNLGVITATGGGTSGHGGDVWFDGKNILGADLGLGDFGANLSLLGSGTGLPGLPFPN